MWSDLVATVRLDAAWHPTPHSTASRAVVVKRYKGPLEPGASVDFWGGGVCYDAPSKPGAVYLVYGRRRRDGKYSTDCTRTQVVGEFRRDIEFLDRLSSRIWLATLIEPLGCNEYRLPRWLRGIWIWNLQRTGAQEW